MRRIYFILALAVLGSVISCRKAATMLVTDLGNDCINRYYYVPYIVGTEMEFAYAMYMPRGFGRIEEASVQCTFPGAAGTRFDNYAYSTDDYGQDLPHRVGDICSDDGNGKYTVTFDIDTVAATLRFHYVIPEQARNKDISFHFQVRGAGRTATFDTPQYHVRKMDMKLDIPVTKDRCFFCMETMQTYTREEVNTAGVPVDFAWVYCSSFTDKSDRSVFFNPARVDEFEGLFSMEMPETELRDTKKMYRYTIIEPQLGRQEFDGFYIDDRDFETLSLDCESAGLAGINNRNGFWVETADAKYRAYVYCNTLNTDNCTISVKRYRIKD